MEAAAIKLEAKLKTRLDNGGLWSIARQKTTVLIKKNGQDWSKWNCGRRPFEYSAVDGFSIAAGTIDEAVENTIEHLLEDPNPNNAVPEGADATLPRRH